MSEAPSPQQLHDAIVRVHTALREAWPSGEGFAEADADWNTKIAWMGQWGKAREGWIKTVQDQVARLALAPADELNEWAQSLIDSFEQSAHDFRVAMMETLPDKPQDGEGE
jgi:hypothetical protein